MKNIRNYKKKFYRLLESDLGDVKPMTDNSVDIDDSDDTDKVETAIEKIGLTPDEIELLTSEYQDLGKQGFKQEVQSIIDTKDENSELYEEEEMSDKEFKIRTAIDKIINKVGVLSALGIVPAAMAFGAPAGIAAGVTALVGLLLKDSAWWGKKGDIGHMHYDKSAESRKGWHDQPLGKGLFK